MGNICEVLENGLTVASMSMICSEDLSEKIIVNLQEPVLIYTIIAILDNEGRVVVKYTYDAWGNTVTEV